MYGAQRMYALIASDSIALRNAAAILLPNVDPELDVQFASTADEIEHALATGLVRCAMIDTNLPGYGREFDIIQLGRDYPHIRFSCLATAPAHVSAFERRIPAPARYQPAVPDLTARTDDRGNALTARQNDVLRLLREGRSTKEIARRLGLAVPTVKTHLAAVYRQLGARNRVEAVMNSVNSPARSGGPFDSRIMHNAAAVTA